MPHTGIVRQSDDPLHGARPYETGPKPLLSTRGAGDGRHRSLVQKEANMNDTLEWGHHYLMVEPNHFRVDYSINPFMHLDDQPDPTRARRQWLDVVAAIEAAGGTVEVLPQLPDAPDMVYAMNLGLALQRRRRRRPPGSSLSHMRYAAATHGDARRRGMVRRARVVTPLDRPRRRRCPLRGRRRVRLAWRAGRRLRPAHRGAGAQAPRHRPRRERPRRPDHAPRDVPHGHRLLPARRDPRDGLPRGVRRARRRPRCSPSFPSRWSSPRTRGWPSAPTRSSSAARS